MERADKAREIMAGGGMNCAQATFTAFCEDLGLERNTALQIAQGFGGGMHINGACGAITGAYMAIGLAHKIPPENAHASIEKTNELLKEFTRQFVGLHGSLTCSGLTGHDFSQPGEAAKARKKGIFNSVCPVLVRDAVKIAEGLLELK